MIFSSLDNEPLQVRPCKAAAKQQALRPSQDDGNGIVALFAHGLLDPNGEAAEHVGHEHVRQQPISNDGNLFGGHRCKVVEQLLAAKRLLLAHMRNDGQHPIE